MSNCCSSIDGCPICRKDYGSAIAYLEKAIAEKGNDKDRLKKAIKGKKWKKHIKRLEIPEEE